MKYLFIRPVFPFLLSFSLPLFLSISQVLSPLVLPTSWGGPASSSSFTSFTSAPFPSPSRATQLLRHPLHCFSDKRETRNSFPTFRHRLKQSKQTHKLHNYNHYKKKKKKKRGEPDTETQRPRKMHEFNSYPANVTLPSDYRCNNRELKDNYHLFPSHFPSMSHG